MSQASSSHFVLSSCRSGLSTPITQQSGFWSLSSQYLRSDPLFVPLLRPTMLSSLAELYKALAARASVPGQSYSSVYLFLSKRDLSGLVVLVLFSDLRVYSGHCWVDT
jgi:hypothetical protein